MLALSRALPWLFRAGEVPTKRSSPLEHCVLCLFQGLRVWLLAVTVCEEKHACSRWNALYINIFVMFVIANVISKQALGDWGLETFTAHHLTPSWPDGSLYATVNPCCSCKEMLLLVWLLLSLLFGRCLFFFFFSPSTSSFVPVFANTFFYCDGKRLCSSRNTRTNTFSPSISDTVWKAFCNALCEEHCVPVSAFAYWAVQCIPITTGNVTIQCPLHFAETTCEKQVASCYHTTCDGSVSLLSWNFLALPFWMGEEKMDKKILFILWDPSKSPYSYP